VLEIDGKQVLTSLAELVDPGRAAIVLIDLQKDFMDPDGEFARLGLDLSMYPPMRRTLTSFLAAGRATGVLTVHVQMSTLPGRRSDSPAHLRFNMRMHEQQTFNQPPLLHTVIGTPGHRFIDECTPEPGEPVVAKWRSSGFWGTNLDLILRSNDIETVVIAGCTTEGCVDSTARDAMFNDYYVVLVEDCVASDDPVQHDAAMLLMSHRFDIASAAEISACWTSSAPDQTAQTC